MARLSMRDVAALAQVSIGTVSNVLNNPDRVLPSTRERVEKAIAELGWVPNQQAQQLRAGRGRTIGLAVMDVTDNGLKLVELAEGVSFNELQDKTPVTIMQ